jgi:hypothetical protein
VEDFRNGVGDGVKTMMTFWMKVPNPDVTNDDGSPVEVIGYITSNLLWISAFVMCLGVLFGAIKMMIDLNGAPFKQMMKMLGGYLAVSSVGVLVVSSALAIADAISTAILDKSTIGTSFVDNLFSLFTNEAGLTSAVVLLIFLLIGMVLAGIQCGIMIVKGGALFALLGTLPVTAAASGFDTGAQAFRTQCGWILAFIIYQPAAAIIYGVGFRLIGTDTTAAENGLLQIMYGLSLIGLAILALPAILRLVIPAVSPMAGGRGTGSVVMGAGLALSAGALRSK